MTNVAELSRINQWMIQQLRSDPVIRTQTAGRVYADMAPQGTTGKMVVFSFLGGADKLLTSRSRLTGVLYLVRAIADGSSYDLVESVADRIEAVLVVPDEGTVVREVRLMSCFREQPHQRKDAENGVPVVYMGGFYRVRFQPANQ